MTRVTIPIPGGPLVDIKTGKPTWSYTIWIHAVSKALGIDPTPIGDIEALSVLPASTNNTKIEIDIRELRALFAARPAHHGAIDDLLKRVKALEAMVMAMPQQGGEIDALRRGLLDVQGHVFGGS